MCSGAANKFSLELLREADCMRVPLQFVYDLKNQPLTFDFVTYLAFAHILSGVRGNKFELTVLADEFRNIHEMERFNSESMKQWRLQNIITGLLHHSMNVASFRLVLQREAALNIAVDWPQGFDLRARNAKAPSPVSLHHPTIHLLYDLYEKTGIHPKFLKVGQKFHNSILRKTGNLPFCTVSVRYSSTGVDRNTKPEHLRAILDGIQSFYSDRLFTFVIGDQDHDPPDEILAELRNRPNVFFDSFAQWNLTYRLEQYAGALFNVAWNTGPASVLNFNAYPYLILGTFTSTAAVSSIDFLSRKGPAYQRQMPWATHEQVLDWCDGAQLSYRYIRGLIEDYCGTLR